MQFHLKRTIIYECERKASKESVGPSELCDTRRMPRILPLAKPRISVLIVPIFPAVVETENGGYPPKRRFGGVFDLFHHSQPVTTVLDISSALRDNRKSLGH